MWQIVSRLSRLMLTASSLGFTAGSALAADPYSIIHMFNSGGIGGKFPYGGVAADANGNLYGTTFRGGGTKDNCGVVYRLTKPASEGAAWDYRVLRQIGLTEGQCQPVGTPVVMHGYVYGTTIGRGSFGPGSVFRTQTSQQNFDLIHEFHGRDGRIPGGVVAGPDGGLYGTTQEGGEGGSSSCAAGGVLYRSPPGKSFAVLHNFGEGIDGTSPSGVVFGSDGALYGSTGYRCEGGERKGGVVYRRPLDGPLSIIYKFKNAYVGRISVGPDGTVYGSHGGGLFTLSPGASGQLWTFTQIYKPEPGVGTLGGDVVFDASGNLYGTTFKVQDDGISPGAAVLFRLSPPTAGGQWIFTRLHIFPPRGSDSSDGVSPRDLLLRSGVLYGTTSEGGEKSKGNRYGAGVVFQYVLPAEASATKNTSVAPR